GHDRVPELGRRDPLAARLDDVFGPVDDLDVAVGRDLGHVAGAEPLVLGQLAGVVAVVVAPSDPRPSDLDLGESDAVPGQLFAAGRVGDPGLDAGHHHTLRPAHIELVLPGGAGARPADAADRGRLGPAARGQEARPA